MSACLCVIVHVCAHARHTVRVEVRGRLTKSVLLFHREGSGIKLSCQAWWQHLYQLNCFTASQSPPSYLPSTPAETFPAPS